MTWSRHELGQVIPPRLIHQVTLQSLPGTKNAFGEPSAANWTNGTVVPASVEPLSGREYLRGEQMVGESTHRVWMRWIAGGLTAKQRLEWTFQGVTQVLEVIQSTPVRGLPRWLEVMCKAIEGEPAT